MAENVRPDNENLMNCQSLNTDSDWQLGGSNMTDSSVRLTSAGNSVVVRQGNILESSSCSSATMVNSLCTNMWDQPAGSQNLGFSGINVHDSEAVPNALGNRSSGLDPLRDGFDSISGLGWSSPDGLLKGGMFLSGAAGLLPQGLPHFPADSGFIERAARYSCFSGGNFGEILNPFTANEALNPESEALASIQRSQEAFSRNEFKPMLGAVFQKNETNMAESSKRVCLSAEHGVSEGSPLKIEKHSGGLGRSKSEAKLGVNDLSNDSEEADFSGRGVQMELESAVGDSSRAASIKKRKRSGPDSDLDQYMGPREPQAEADKDQRALEQKGKQNLTSTFNKSGGKNGKQGPQASDSPKEEYIHVRARRGQATNSHSLAERVRREKISERMKFLQDLVPGCSKVTGKAVMLDEIINYVQSLQRQVEFLSMKLATVNPQLDFSLERLLTKDILQSGAGPSSSLAFAPDIPMSYPPSHQSHGVAQTGIQGLLNTADILRRSMNSSLTAIDGGFKEPSSHVSANWEDELRNAIQMGLISTTSINSHDMSAGSLPASHTRPDL